MILWDAMIRYDMDNIYMYNYVYIYVYQLSRNGMTSIICHDRETMRNDIDMPMVNQDNVWRGSIPLTGIQKPPCAVDQG
jgi:hypothetical protein